MHLVGILFPHINDDARSKSHQIYKLLYTTDSLIEFEVTQWNCFHVRISHSPLYEWTWNLLICIHPNLEFKIFFFHIIAYKSSTGIFLGMFFYFSFRFSGGYPSHGSNYWCCFWAAVKSLYGKEYWGSLVLNLEV